MGFGIHRRLVKQSTGNEAVVDAALRAYVGGRREIVTGAQNRALALLASRLPLPLVLAAADRIGRRRKIDVGSSGA